MAIYKGIYPSAEDFKQCDFDSELVSIHIHDGLMHYEVAFDPADAEMAKKKNKKAKKKNEQRTSIV